jgi:hypothetical protein
MQKEGTATVIEDAIAYADTGPYKNLLEYFDPQVLAAYRNEPDKYHVETHFPHGKVTLTQRYQQELEAANRSDDFIYMPFGYRTLENGSHALVAFVPDLLKISKRHVQGWSGFILRNPKWNDEDPGFLLWTCRNLKGEWVGGPSVSKRLAQAIHKINCLTDEALAKPLFTHELPSDLAFPAGENSHRYQDAHEELYRYLIDGLDRECIRQIATRLRKPAPREKWTVQDLKKVFPNLADPASFSRAYDLIMEQRRFASHKARPAAEPMKAFEQFGRDLECCLTGLEELLATLEKELNMNPARATARNDAKKHLPKIAAPPSGHFSICQASQMEGKTVARVEFGFATESPEHHHGELLIIHFTDGSILSIDTHTNAASLPGHPEGIKPSDFDVSYSLHWVPPM